MSHLKGKALIYMVISLLMIFTFTLTACNGTPEVVEEETTEAETGGETEAETGAETGDGDTIRIALILGDLGNPFFNTVAEFATERAKEYPNVELSVFGTSTLEDQVKTAEDQIAAQVDVIGLSPHDAQGIGPTVLKANEAGIPVITIDENSAVGEIATYIATDNVEGGRLAGEWLVKAMNGQGKLAILEGGAGSSNNNYRLEGFHSEVDKSDIEIVASLPADWNRDRGLNVMTDILTGNPDVDAVMAMNDEMALGALQAIEAAGKQDEIILVGYNGALEAIKAVYEGKLAADVVQFPEEMGQLFVDWSLKILAGEKAPALINPAVVVVDSQLAGKAMAAITGEGLSLNYKLSDAPSEPVRFAVILADMSNPFWGTVQEGAVAAASSVEGIDLTVLGGLTLEEQIRMMEDQIALEVDVIGIAPLDPEGISPTIIKANEAGIPVITIDQTSASGEIETYIATDNVEGGRIAGVWLVKAMGGAGKLAILEGDPGSTTNNARLEGILGVLENYPDIEIVASLPANWNRDKGLNVMNDILTGNPDINAVMAMNDEMALGALQSLIALDKLDDVILVGYNGALEAIESVFDGNLSSDIVQYPEEMGKLFVEYAIRVINGETIPDRLKPAVQVVDTQLLRKINLAVMGE